MTPVEVAAVVMTVLSDLEPPWVDDADVAAALCRPV